MTNPNFPELPSHEEALRILDVGYSDHLRQLAHHVLIVEQMKARATPWFSMPLGLIEQRGASGQCAVCDSIWMYAGHLAAHAQPFCSDPIGAVLRETALTLASFSNRNPPHEVAWHLGLVH